MYGLKYFETKSIASNCFSIVLHLLQDAYVHKLQPRILCDKTAPIAKFEASAIKLNFFLKSEFCKSDHLLECVCKVYMLSTIIRYE